MTHSNEKMHVYRRDIDGSERTSLSVLAGLVDDGAKVLDLGTGSGALGAFLREHHGAQVDGVTYNADEAAVARPHYRRLEVADLDDGTWAEAFRGETYDAIVCADVLEHLKRPERVLSACTSLLAPRGRLLISIPNVGYSGLVAELLTGEFAYRDEGLLDRTHLRFFTRRSLLRFLNGEGWRVDAIERIERALPESEFRVAFDSLPPAVARHLLARPDALTYQFIAVAQPGDGAQGVPREAPGADAVAQALFSAQLFPRRAHGYDEHRKQVAAGVIGQERQTLVFPMPDDGDTVTGLRLDPADRPGFVHLYGMALVAADGTRLWQWQGDAGGFGRLQAARHQDLVVRPPWHGAAATPILLHGDDPWFEVPIPDAVFADPTALAGARFEVELGWPMSADYLALSEVVAPLQAHLESVQQDAARELGVLQEALERERTEAHDALERERTESQQAMDRERAEALQALDHERTEAALLDAALAQARSERTQLVEHTRLLDEDKQDLARQHRGLQAAHARLEAERDALAQHLQWIENSTVFRATRPLVKLKMRIDARRRGEPAAQHAAPLPAPRSEELPALAAAVDVIVPVYRGLDDTRRCIESALAASCRTPFRLVVINDASPEPEVTDWLRSLQDRDPRLVLLENEANLGFVGTVNRGMALSQSGDVVLLNSDAEVANDWLDRMVMAAYSDRRVASVTPFSNNATICSYPKFCAANELPAGWDTARLDRLFAQTLAGQVMDIPTGVGFCMYIRRACLDEVGLFDVEAFGKGYGEENDFCRRAAKAGWRNLHALDVFARHAGGGSFGETKSARELAAMETLRRMHPDYERQVHAFVAEDPVREHRQAIDLARLREEGLPVVLAVVHDRAGGTLRHVDELAANLRGQANFLKLVPGGGGTVLLTRPDPAEALALSFKIESELDGLVQLLRDIGVVHLHFHHLIGHAPEILDLPRRLHLSYDFTAHDYYTFCPQISLTDHRNSYCGEQGPEQCRACLQRSPAPGGASIEAWRAHYGGFVGEARHVLAPSRDAARRLHHYFPQARVHCAPHTDFAPDERPPVPAPRPIAADAPLRIAVIGALSPIKGADVLEDLAVLAAREQAPVDLHLIGFAYRSLRTMPKARLTVHGEYDDKDLPRLLEWLRPDLVWFPAQWPETYSYTLSACLKLGLPVVAPDLGAFPERLAGRPWTWVRPWNTSIAQWLAFFTQLRTRHFATGTAPLPQPVAAPPAADVLIRPWAYGRDYLQGLPRATPGLLPTPAMLARYRPGRGEGLLGSPHRVKTGLLLALVRLRAAPGLRQVARAIPLRWQTRVKTWLRA